MFLVCIVLFQQLHHLDLPATLQHMMGGRDPPPAPTQVPVVSELPWRDLVRACRIHSWWPQHGRSSCHYSMTAPCLQAVIDAWMVDYNAALATICFMLFLGGQCCLCPYTLVSMAVDDRW